MTRIDTPLELTSLRDDDPTPARYRPSGSTLPTRIAALLAIAAAALAAGDANSASVGPGRFVLLIVVIAWSVGALVTSVFRPAEQLAALMTLTGGTIALAMLASAEAANHPNYDVTAIVRAIAIAALPAVGTHLVLGLPDGRVGDRTRRRWALVVDGLAVGFAVWCIAARPDIPLAGMIGMSRGRGRGRTHRLRGAVPAGTDPGRAGTAAVAGMGCAHRRRDRARRGRARRARRLAEGAARRDGRRHRPDPALAHARRPPVAGRPHRPPAGPHHHLRRARRTGRAGGARRRRRARPLARQRGTQRARTVDRRCGHRRAALGPGA